MTEEVLRLHRYTPNWVAHDDHKVNPKCLNDPDPTDTTGITGTGMCTL